MSDRITLLFELAHLGNVCSKAYYENVKQQQQNYYYYYYYYYY